KAAPCRRICGRDAFAREPCEGGTRLALGRRFPAPAGVERARPVCEPRVQPRGAPQLAREQGKDAFTPRLGRRSKVGQESRLKSGFGAGAESRRPPNGVQRAWERRVAA